ncbi:addiction module HigA family antidote [Oxalobacteraceae bacterium GrIS 2.11]
MQKNKMRPIHPGEILREEYLQPLNMTPHALAKALHLHAARINEIVRENRGVTSDTALRLARYFGTTPEFWLNLQMAYDLRSTQKDVLKMIEKEIQPLEIQAA